ncbi:MAG: dTDP-4-dehydrorhamnose reductase [Bdellovibrionales bacterium]|nr:dTDP-4-dehydrorhamnose reductase [Bdellovibrionales bacterium]
MNSAFDRVLVTGATGQLGRALLAQLGPHRCIAASREVLPLHFPEALPHRLDYFRPRAIFNAGAYTAVDQAEQESESITVRAVNEESPAKLARWCAVNRVPLIHFSTDYVFDGSGDQPKGEIDPTGPLNRYGLSKLAGENEILSSGCRALIFRTSWVYDHRGKNFLKTMLRLGVEKDTLRVVDDQIGAPTFAPQLADAAIRGLENALIIEEKTGSFPSGVYHLCHRGATSWHGFAEAIFSRAKDRGVPLKVQHLEKITTEQYPTPARRPKNSRLDCSKAERTLGVRLPEWQVGLEECLDLWFAAHSTQQGDPLK